MTVAEMERLEHAARLSLGGLPDADVPSATAPRYIQYGRIIGLALIVMAALAITMDLL